MFLFCSICVKKAFHLFPRLFLFFIIAVQTTKNTYHEREEQSHEHRNDDYLCDRRPGRCIEHGLSDDQFSGHHCMENLPSLQVRIYFVRIKKKEQAPCGLLFLFIYCSTNLFPIILPPSLRCPQTPGHVSLTGPILTCVHTRFRQKNLLQQVR